MSPSLFCMKIGKNSLEMENVKNKSEKQRIEYIDIVKGVCILWVLLYSYFTSGGMVDIKEIKWLSWLEVPYPVFLFFFISGIFFRINPFRDFLKKGIKTLIIPFLGFWFIGFLCAIVKYELIANFISTDYTEISFVEYATALKGLFYLCPDIPPHFVNHSLWFLMVLFFVQLFHYFCCKFIKRKEILVFIGLFLFIIAGNYLYEQKISGPFYLSGICELYLYYLTGHFWGKEIINIVEKKRKGLKLMLICCLLILTALSFVHTDNFTITQILIFIRSICIYPIIVAVCKLITHLKSLATPLKYCGIHSLEILVTFVLVFEVLNNLIFKVILRLPGNNPLEHV